MATAVIILILVVICIFAVRGYMKKLAHGCCGGESGEEKVRVRDKNPAHYPHCVKLTVEGMTCSNCKQRVENALNEEEGVWAQVDLKHHSALVRMKTALPEENLREIVTRAGYSVTGVETVQG